MNPPAMDGDEEEPMMAEEADFDSEGDEEDRKDIGRHRSQKHEDKLFHSAAHLKRPFQDVNFCSFVFVSPGVIRKFCLRHP